MFNIHGILLQGVFMLHGAKCNASVTSIQCVLPSRLNYIEYSNSYIQIKCNDKCYK
jgi:hypothetical protein